MLSSRLKTIGCELARQESIEVVVGGGRRSTMFNDEVGALAGGVGRRRLEGS